MSDKAADALSAYEDERRKRIEAEQTAEAIGNIILRKVLDNGRQA